MTLQAFRFETRNYLVFLCLSLLMLTVALSVGLTDNEAYYWSWSLNPDASYFDHPPLHAWTMWFLGTFLPKSNLVVRLPALLSCWVTTYLFTQWAMRFQISRQVSLAFLISSPLFFVFSWVSLPDVLLFPLGLLTIEFAYRRYYSLAGLALGLALLAKWHAILLVPGLILTVFYQEKTLLLRLRSILVPAIVSAIFQTPVLLWNWKHDWVSVKYHLLARHVEEASTIIDYFSRSVLYWGGFLVFGGLIFAYAAAVYLKEKRYSIKDVDDKILLTYALPFIAIFFISALKGQSRIYWSAFAYFPLTILFFRRLNEKSAQTIQRWSIRSAVTLTFILLSVVFLPVGAYVKPLAEKFGRYDIRFSPVGSFIGWDQWANAEVSEHMRPDRKSLFLASDIRLAAQLMWSSDLDLRNVHVMKPIKQFSIWKQPDVTKFKTIVFFGDNRRKLKIDQAKEICDPIAHAPTLVYLQNRLVKRIDQAQCEM